MKRDRLIAAGFAALMLAPLAGAQQKTVVRGGTVHNPDGSSIENAIVVIEDGMITAVAADAEVPYDATVIEADGMTVFPGMVMAHTSMGLDRANERLPITPFVDVYDSLDPSSVSYQDALRDGVTTLHVIQGNDTVVAGLSRVVRPQGMMVEDMTVRPSWAIKVSITPKNGLNRMSQMFALRKAFDDLDRAVRDTAEKLYEEAQKKKGEEVLLGPDAAAEEGMKELEVDDLDSKWRTLYRVKNGDFPIFLHCDSASDVHRGIDWVTEMGLLEKVTFVLGTQTHKAVDAIAATGRPVVLSGNLVHRERDPVTNEESETFVPKVFADAGVAFALQTFGGSMGERHLWYQAARLVREGVSRETALASVTQTAADIIGLGDHAGSIATGKFGNLLLLSGDPLDQATTVEHVLLEGNVAYTRSEDRRLQELLTGEDVNESEDD